MSTETIPDAFLKPFLQPISLWESYDVQILRDDLIHPFVSGNKWRKLKYNIDDFKMSEKKCIVTFGGAFSNHLVATAAASKIFRFETIGIVRGEEIENDYIRFLKQCGMKLLFMNREEYRKKEDPSFVNSFLATHDINPGVCFIIPEGGSNEAAVRGCSEIMNDVGETDYTICACGTGATLAGIARGLQPGQTAVGIPVLKAPGYMESQVKKFNGSLNRVLIVDDYHFGGYAKSTAELIDFCKNFIMETGIPAEPVYTGKMLFAVNELIRKKFFPPKSKITVIHSGGIFDFTTPFPQ